MFIYIYIYYTMRKISNVNMGFGSANIERYYMAQQLIAQLRQRAVKWQSANKMVENSMENSSMVEKLFPWFILVYKQTANIGYAASSIQVYMMKPVFSPKLMNMSFT